MPAHGVVMVAGGGGRMYGRFTAWYGAQSDAVKALAMFAVLLGLPMMLVVLALLSPLVAVVALLALLVGTIGFVVVALKHGLLRRWGVVVMASLVLLLVFGGASYAFYGGGPEEVRAAAPEITEEGDPKVGKATEETPPPEERLRSKIVGTFVAPEEAKKIAVRDVNGGCKQVQVDYLADGTGLIEYQMEEIYTALYGDKKLGGRLCGVTVTAYGTLTDDYGQRSEKRFYSTSIGRKIADRIDWQDPSSVNFPQEWKLNYIHPAVEQALAEDEVREALDCAEDEGLFDFDMFCS